MAALHVDTSGIAEAAGHLRRKALTSCSNVTNAGTMMAGEIQQKRRRDEKELVGAE